MITKSLKNLIKKAKKEKETIILYCNICKFETKFRGTVIRVKAMKKEFNRQHNHRVGFFKRIFMLLKRGDN